MRRCGFHASAWRGGFQAGREEPCLCASRKRRVEQALPVMVVARARSPQKGKINMENTGFWRFSWHLELRGYPLLPRQALEFPGRWNKRSALEWNQLCRAYGARFVFSHFPRLAPWANLWSRLRRWDRRRGCSTIALGSVPAGRDAPAKGRLSRTIFAIDRLKPWNHETFRHVLQGSDREDLNISNLKFQI